MTNISFFTSHPLLNSSDNHQQMPLAVHNVFIAYTSSVKNIENSTNFIIRNLISSYIKIPLSNGNNSTEDNKELKVEHNYTLKDTLHDNEKLCLILANQAITLINNKKSNLIISKQLKLEQGLNLRKSTRKIPKKLKLDEFGQPLEPSVYYLKPFEQVIDKTTFYQHIDCNLIQNILKLKEKLNPTYKDFTLVNSHVANAAVDNVINNYTNFYKSIKSYCKNPALFTGIPKLPKYHNKNNRCAFKLDKYKFQAKDKIAARVITIDNINDFTSIKDKNNINQLFLDSAKTKPVSKEDIEIYNQFNLMPFINNKLNKVLINEKQQLSNLETIYNHNNNQSKSKINNKFMYELEIEFVELKVIPLKNKNKLGHEIKLEVVLKHTLNLPEKSMLNQLLLIYPKFLELSEKDKIKIVQNYNKNNLTKKNKVKISSIDLGNRNLCTISYNDSSEGLIVTGNNYFKSINKIDSKIDKRKSELNNKVVREIQSNLDKAKNRYLELKLKYNEDIKLTYTKNNYNLSEKELNDLVKVKLDNKKIKYPELNKQDKALLEEYETQCREDKFLIKQQSYKNNYVDDFVHKLSTKIITNCLNKSIDYLVIGKNDNWKKNSNIGKINNRNSYNFPHTELINHLKYKALKFGLVVLVTEESYTSKTSFINHAELKTYTKKEIINKDNNENKLKEINNIEKKEVDIKSLEENPRNKPLLPDINLKKVKKVKGQSYGGYRKTRDKYINKDNLNINKVNIDELKVVNADMNGSFNIMRKVFLEIKYNEQDYNFNYRLVCMKENKKGFKSIIKNKVKQNCKNMV